jgi:hypothetical protein
MGMFSKDIPFENQWMSNPMHDRKAFQAHHHLIPFYWTLWAHKQKQACIYIYEYIYVFFFFHIFWSNMKIYKIRSTFYIIHSTHKTSKSHSLFTNSITHTWIWKKDSWMAQNYYKDMILQEWDFFYLGVQAFNSKFYILVAIAILTPHWPIFDLYVCKRNWVDTTNKSPCGILGLDFWLFKFQCL